MSGKFEWQSGFNQKISRLSREPKEAAPESAGTRCAICRRPLIDGLCREFGVLHSLEPATERAPETHTDLCDKCGKSISAHRDGKCYPDTFPKDPAKYAVNAEGVGKVPERPAPLHTIRMYEGFCDTGRDEPMLVANIAYAYMDTLESRNAELTKELNDTKWYLGCRASDNAAEKASQLLKKRVELSAGYREQQARAENAEREVERLTKRVGAMLAAIQRVENQHIRKNNLPTEES